MNENIFCLFCIVCTIDMFSIFGIHRSILLLDHLQYYMIILKLYLLKNFN